MSTRRNLSLSKLSLPILLEMGLRNCTVLIITFMVSVYANHLVPALGAGNEIFDLALIVFTFASQGCSVVLSQVLGAKRHFISSGVVHQSLLLNLIIGLICGFITFFGATILLGCLNIPAQLVPASKIYLQMLAICLLLDAICIILTDIIRVCNYPYYTMMSSFIMDFVTIFATYYALNHSTHSIFGVGCAILLGRVANFISLALVYAFKIRIKFELRKLFRYNKVIMVKLLSVGIFSGGEYLVWGIQYIVAFAFIALLGDVAIGVQTIFFQISMLMMLTSIAISQANSIIVAKLIGARWIDLAYRHTWGALIVCVGASTFIATMVYFAQDYIMDAFKLDSEYRLLMTPLFAISIVLEFVRSFNILLINSLDSAGDMRFPFYMACLSMWGISLPVGYILCFHMGFGLIGIWIGFLADESVRALAHSWRWWSRRWEGKALV